MDSFSVDYIIDSGGFTATLTNTLHAQGSKWQYRSRGSKFLVGKIIKRSDFYVQGGNFLLDTFYSYERFGLSGDELTISVDRTDAKLRISNDDDQPLKEFIVFDEASQHLAIQCLIRSGYYEFQLPIMRDDGVKRAAYDVRAVENIDTHDGEYQTIKLEQERADDDDHFVFWVAPDLDYIPVKFAYFDDGVEKEFEAVMKKYSFD